MYMMRNATTGFFTDLYDSREEGSFRLAVLKTHGPESCEGRGCNIHHPSFHSMVTFPLYWRTDRGIAERICSHEVGHPDPDQLIYWNTLRDDGIVPQGWVDAQMVHGCDGCCEGAYDE